MRGEAKIRQAQAEYFKATMNFYIQTDGLI